MAEAALPAKIIVALVEEFAAELEVVTACPAVLEVAQRSEDLVASDVAEPAVPVAAADDVGGQVLVRWGLGVAIIRPEVVELAAVYLEEHLVAGNVVPTDLVRVCPVGLVPRRIGAVVDRSRGANQLRVQPVRLLLLAPLSEPDQLVVRVQRVGALAGDVLQMRFERLHRKVRQQALRVLIAQRAVPPELVFFQVAADVAVEIVIAVESVQIGGLETAAALDAECDLRVVDVARLDVLVFVVGVDAAVIGVAARFRDELRHHAGPRHVRRVRAGRHRDFLHRPVVVVEAGRVRPLGVDDAFDHRPMLIGLRVVGGVARLRAGRAPAHVDPLHLDGRRRREDRPEVARVRQRGELLRVEVRGRLRGRDVDHGRLPADGDRFGEARDAELDVHG